MGIQFMVIAGIFIALSNLCMRKSIDAGGMTKGYLMIQMFLTFIIMILINPVRTGNYSWDTSVGIFALFGGILLASFMIFLGKALEHGPPGLSVALLNCSSIMPILLLVIFFGTQFGFYYTLWNAMGSILVIIGICWAGWDGGLVANRKKWLLCVTMAFFIHSMYLFFLHWRTLFMNFPNKSGLFFSFSPQAAGTEWFMPMIFLSASLIQIFLFFSQEKRIPYRSEVFYGSFGSIANGLGAFFITKAIEVSTSMEHAMIFPIFSVTLIIGCNVWGRLLYQESVNWKATSVCIAGILVGTIDWKAFVNL